MCPAVIRKRAEKSWGNTSRSSGATSSEVRANSANGSPCSSSPCSASVHSVMRAKPWAGSMSPVRPGPNHGKHRGTPPRMARPVSLYAREDTHSTGSCPSGAQDSAWAP